MNITLDALDASYVACWNAMIVRRDAERLALVYMWYLQQVESEGTSHE